MQITVRLFASLRETTGTGQITLALPDGADIRAVIGHLVEAYPGLQGHEAAWHFAVNHAHAEVDTRVREGDRVAIFPYVAGG